MRKTNFAFILIAFIASAAGAADCSFELLGKPLPRAVGVDRADLKMEWRLIQGYTKYKVEIATDPGFSNMVALEDATVTGDFDNARSVTYKVNLPDDQELRSNTAYFWRVTALDGTGACPERISDVRRFKTARVFGATASKRGWLLAEAIEGKKLKEPAKFAWARALDEDTGENDDAYTARFGLKYTGETRPIGSGGQDLAFFAGIFGVLNDHNDKADTALGVAGGVTHVVPFGDGGMSNDYKLKFEGDQDFDTRKAVAEGSFTFASNRLRMGEAPETSGPVRWMWEPTIITAYGRTMERGASTETDDTVLRLGARVDFQFHLQAIAERINAPTVVTISDTGYYLPNEEREYRNLFSAAIDVTVAEGFSVGFEFNHGAEAPEFDRTHSLGITLGLQF